MTVIVKVLLPPKVGAESKVLVHSEDNEVVRCARLSSSLLSRLAGRRWAYFRATVGDSSVDIEEEVTPANPW